MEALRERPDIAAALAALREDDDETLADMVAVTRVPGPTGSEAPRAEWLRQRFVELGFADAGADAAGNLIARWPDSATSGDAIVLAAHLDTVFPVGTEITVTSEDGVLRGPGIADNGRGLAALLAVARALRGAEWTPVRPVVFVGTVGEEGAGNLRGVRHLLRDGAALRRAAAFIAVDGTGRRQIVNRGLGSVRLRFEVAGPGGHSWSDRGRANPLHALAGAVMSMTRNVPAGATITPTRMAGGDSVNAIPGGAWLEVDLRARDAAILEGAERVTRHAVERAVKRMNRRRRGGTPPLRLAVQLIGDRPIGATPPDARVVLIAEAATRLLGEEPALAVASTDANVPLALGIPSIAMGSGGRSGATHTPAEWYDNEGGPEGLQRLLLTLVALCE